MEENKDVIREILFRGKCVESEQYGEWIYGDLAHCQKTTAIIGREPENALWFCSPETISQYTGLTDVNGNKIFEGDIVKLFNGNKYYIDYSEVMASFRMCNKKHAFLEIRRPLTIIGNIYDNPELMN